MTRSLLGSLPYSVLTRFLPPCVSPALALRFHSASRLAHVGHVRGYRLSGIHPMLARFASQVWPRRVCRCARTRPNLLVWPRPRGHYEWLAGWQVDFVSALFLTVLDLMLTNCLVTLPSTYSEDDDLSSFQITFPSLGNNQSLTRTSITYSYTYRYATAPIRLSSACRQIHAALTGPKAKRKEDVNERGLKDAWEALGRSWEEFEGLRHVGPVSSPFRMPVYGVCVLIARLAQVGIIQTEDTERFVNGWQVRCRSRFLSLLYPLPCCR